MNGGDVIGSGGFGCVFKPSLQCDDNDNINKSKNKHITKVMLKHNAEEEYTFQATGSWGYLMKITSNDGGTPQSTFDLISP